MRNIEIGSDGRAIVIESNESEDFVIPLYQNTALEAVTAASPALSVDVYLSVIDATSNGVAATLADGKVHGQLKRIHWKVVSGGACTVTLASPFSSGTDIITATVIGDWVLLLWFDQDDDGAGYWRILDSGNVLGNRATPTWA